MMANKEAIRLWVDALRSGDYVQGRGNLHLSSEDSYCCLGVACDVALKNEVIAVAPWDESLIAAEDDHAEANHDYYYENGVLTPEVQEWLGLPANPVLSDEVGDGCTCGECEEGTTATWAN